MRKKMINLGHSSAVVIDKALMSLLGLQATSVLELTTDGRSILLTPVDVADRRQNFADAAARVGDTVQGTGIKKRAGRPKKAAPAGEAG